MHRNHPQVATSAQTDVAKDDPGNMCFPHTTRSPQTAIPIHRSRDPCEDPSDLIVHRASEPSPSNRWGAPRIQMLAHSNPNNSPGQTSRLNNGTSVNPYGPTPITRAQRRTRT